MDKNNFGKYKSAQVLVGILNKEQDKKTKRKICMFLTRYIEELIQLRLIKDCNFRIALLHERRHYYLNLFKNILNSKEGLITFVNNVIVTLFREELRRII